MNYDNLYSFYTTLKELFKNGIFWLLFVPYASTQCIVLNVYNGDILGIAINLEYMLWYLIPLLIHWGYSYYIKEFNNNLRKYWFEYMILTIGILLNIYWYYCNPWTTNSIRHRTEYYDTQVLLNCYLFYALNRRFNIINL